MEHLNLIILNVLKLKLGYFYLSPIKSSFHASIYHLNMISLSA